CDLVGLVDGALPVALQPDGPAFTHMRLEELPDPVRVEERPVVGVGELPPQLPRLLPAQAPVHQPHLRLVSDVVVRVLASRASHLPVAYCVAEGGVNGPAP